MAPKPLDILRTGLKRLQSKVAVKRDHLLAQLADKKSITSSDEHWLDNDANLVDEERVLDALEKTSDYERGVERLDDKGKAIVTRLRELAGNLLPKVSKKQKCEFLQVVKFSCSKLNEPKMVNQNRQRTSPRPDLVPLHRPKRKTRI
jgi:hypothetical protein